MYPDRKPAENNHLCRISLQEYRRATPIPGISEGIPPAFVMGSTSNKVKIAKNEWYQKDALTLLIRPDKA